MIAAKRIGVKFGRKKPNRDEIIKNIYIKIISYKTNNNKKNKD